MLGMTRRMAYRCSVCESSVCERSVFVSYFVRWGEKDPSPGPGTYYEESLKRGECGGEVRLHLIAVRGSK